MLGGGVDVVRLPGAIVVWYGGGRGGWQPTLVEWTWCHCWPLQGAILVCYGWGEGWRPTLWECAMMGGGEGDGQLCVLWLGGGWRPTLEEWTWCHCCAIAGCQSLFHIFLLYSGPAISPRHPRERQWTLFRASCRRYTVLYIDKTNIVFCYLGSMLV